MFFSENEYILHRCIASVQLTKTHVVERSPINSYNVQKEENNEANAYYDTTMIQQNNKKIRMNDYDRNRYVASKDTPLKTVNIQAIQKDKPLIFKKKHPLPELQRNLTSKLSEMSTNVIVIKSPS